ncbi:hypothetical protein [Phormidium sp. CCY1219]|uniref:hypothetical protein n=1 Tax=Phormidium sp. CCY1219 TaxID=2886104 RepID=UPI002D1EDA06|nr:hypothetical protein [Phormidium sp. CCY1219]MEB3827711.1 hypothetical protein [Phormidium sp. CCY1219]
MLNRFSRKNGLPRIGGFRTSAIALALMAMLLPACNQQEPETYENAEESNVTQEEVAQSAEQLIGQTVSIRGDVEDTGDYPTSFLMDDDTLFGGEEILVINATEYPFVLPEDDEIEVQVTGEVRNLARGDMENELGIDWDAGMYSDWEGKPTIIAQSIVLAPEPEEIVENPAQFYDQPLAVEGEIAEIVGPNVFTLEEENLAIVNVGAGQPLQAGEEVVLTGELRTFVLADLEREYELTWDLDVQEQLEAEFSDRPVFVAEGVYPSAK